MPGFFMPVNTINWSESTINSTNFTDGSINSTTFSIGLVKANSTTVLASSITVLANGQDTSTDSYKQGSLITKPTNWTPT